jgi:hypothetical protein
MPAPRQKSIQRPNLSQSPKRVGSGPGAPPISSGGRSVTAGVDGSCVLPGVMAGVVAGIPDAASCAVNSPDATGSAAETGMHTSVPELAITDHRARRGNMPLMR